MTRGRHRWAWAVGLLVVLALPATQALWLVLGVAHGHVHGADHHASHEHAEHAEHDHDHDHDHQRESALEILLHGHDHQEGAVPHHHDAVEATAKRLVTALPTLAPLSVDAAPAPSPSRYSARYHPVAAATPPLCYLHCSQLI